MFRPALIAVATVLLGAQSVQASDTPSDYRQDVMQWRAERLKALTAPDGWLTLVALDWLQHGANRVGSAGDNDIVIAKLPPHLGTVTWLQDGTVNVSLDSDQAATIDGRHVGGALMLDDSHDKPTTVRVGSVSFYLVDRGGRKGLRVKDSTSPTRTHFAGLDYFPVDPSLRIVARWVPFKPQHTLDMANEIGGVDHFPVPGKAVFERDGHTYTLYPVIEVPGDKQFFLVFADRTSGRETYGAARFLYVDPPRDGKVVIDFNKAYNPPCAFTSFATCPVAPPKNRLGFRVTAGEKAYHGDGI